MEEKKKLVIVGNGMAANRVLDDLFEMQSAQNSCSLPFDITVIGEEPRPAYNRIMLSPVLAGEINEHEIMTRNQQWYHDHNVTLLTGTSIEFIDREHHKLIGSSGEVYLYDFLVLALGSTPSRIPAANQHLKGINVFRTLSDVDHIKSKINSDDSQSKHAVVVGGGFLGLEAAYGIARQGMSVTLVHRSAWLLNRQLDAKASVLLQSIMSQHNIDFRLNEEIESFVGDEEVQAVRLKSGNELPCSLAIIATGITPNTGLAKHSDLSCGRGIQVDNYLCTSASNIYALGECCECEGETFGLVEPIWQQSKVLAAHLLRKNSAPYQNSAVATRLKVSGVQLFSAGEHLSTEGAREILYQDIRKNIYRKILIRDDHIVGIVLLGDTRSAQDYYNMMLNKTPVKESVDALILGVGFYEFAA